MQIKDEKVIHLLYKEASGLLMASVSSFPIYSFTLMDKPGFLLQRGPGLLTVAL